jgi:membrane carboxypeptidase/penicillin-binding protein
MMMAMVPNGPRTRTSRSLPELGKEALLDEEDSGHVHHAGEHVVAALRAVHVVVGVHCRHETS